MRWKKAGVVLVGIVLLIAAFVVVGNTIDDEKTPEQSLFDEDLVVEDLEVNGEDEQLVIHENETVTVTATLTNEGDDTIDVPLVVEWYEDEELVTDDPHRDTLYEDLEPDETEDVSWTRDHFGWWPDNYMVRVGEETVNVIVVEDLNITVEDLEVNGESDHLEIGTYDPVTVTATVTNDGDDPVDVPLYIAWDYELDQGHKDSVYVGLQPGETEEVEWEREEHGTWWPDEYTIIVGEESVNVTVEEYYTVDEFSVNEETEEVEVSLDEEVEIYAEVTNNADEEVDMVVTVEEDGDLISGAHSFEETIEADGTGVIDESFDHDGWYAGDFVVRLEVDDTIDETIDVTLVEDADLVIEEFTVNDETDEVELDLDEEVEIYVEVRNDRDDDVEMTVTVKEDGQEIEIGRHSFDETALADGEGIIEEDWDHDGWYEGEFTVVLEVGDGELEESITVTLVEDDDVDDDEVDWDEMRIIIGLIIAAFVIGIGVGVIWSKKGY